MEVSLKQHLLKTLEDSKRMYLADLEAMSEEALGKCPGGAARTPFDFTYECVVVNRRFAKRLQGEDPGPMASQDWITAPEEFRRKDRAIEQVRESMDALIALWKELPETRLFERIELPKGETSPYDLIALAGVHLGYHDAQLNYHQAICGDASMHWQD